MKGFEPHKNKHKFPTFISEEDDDEEDELPFLKANQLGQLGLLRQQQATDANNAKKGVGAMNSNNNKMNNNVGNGNAGKKGNPNENMEMKVINPNGIDQKTMAAMKMNNVLKGESINAGGDVKRGNEINAMMNLAANVPTTAAALGRGNPNGLNGFQAMQPNIGYQDSPGAAGFPNGGYATGGQYPSSAMRMNHPSQRMNKNMNMQNRHAAIMQQPQMMYYHRSPYIPPNTGYYYNYSPAPYSSPEQPNNIGDHSAAAATTHMFSDENASSCSVM